MKSAIVVALIVFTVLAGCTTGVGVVEREVKELSRLAQGESITLLPDQWLQGTGDDTHLAECVLDAMQTTTPDLRYIPHQNFRDTLFPWLEPETVPPSSQLADLLKNALVADAVRKLDVRYIIVITGHTVGGEEKGGIVSLFIAPGPGPSFWGAVSGERQSRISATLWDLKKIGPAPSVDVNVRGQSVVAAIYLPVLFIPAVTEGPACRELGDRLVRYLTGENPQSGESVGSSPAIIAPEEASSQVNDGER